MKLPGPDHPITVARNPKRVRALYNGHVIADTAAAVLLKEAGYKPVQYFPREDVAMEYLNRSALKTQCPYKGEASYYSITRDGLVAENVVWSYEHPYPAMALIEGLVAFYPDQVDIHEIDDHDERPDIAKIILHTDSGAGGSQQEHWPTNVPGPLG
jgi:uncharacterized protein (DUF427 family)